jgi:hypothetical protein
MATTKSDTLNYRGELALIGQNATPFFRAISGSAKRTSSFLFPLAQAWSLSAASQSAITEDASIVAGTPTTVTRAERTNTVQIEKYDVAVSFKKQSTSGQMSGINTNDANPVVDELTFQKTAQLRQMAINVEYAFLNGTYAAATNTATAAKTRGLVTGTTTNAVNASSAKLSKALIQELLRTMAGTGSPFQDPVILVNAFQRQLLSDIYGYAPMDRTLGGLSIKQIETDFGMFGVLYTPQLSTSVLQIAELSVCSPVYVPFSFTPDGGVQDVAVTSPEGIDVAWVPTATTAAARGGFWYTQIGIDYGPEEYHGKITSLATS